MRSQARITQTGRGRPGLTWQQHGSGSNGCWLYNSSRPRHQRMLHESFLFTLPLMRLRPSKFGQGPHHPAPQDLATEQSKHHTSPGRPTGHTHPHLSTPLKSMDDKQPYASPLTSELSPSSSPMYKQPSTQQSPAQAQAACLRRFAATTFCSVELLLYTNQPGTTSTPTPVQTKCTHHFTSALLLLVQKN